MIKIIIDKLPRVTKNRTRLEKLLNVKITNERKEVSISGNAEDEYVAEKVLQALDIGFPYSTATLIKTKDLVLETLNIKDYSKGKNLTRVRGRVIGTQGKALQIISNLSDCSLEIKDNQVGIIGNPEDIKRAVEAIILIIQGAKHGNVYSGLMKSRGKSKIEEFEDLGLK